jgi:cytochrome oxidase Cu insertion factor (SCO1/SenC/PrrC family)
VLALGGLLALAGCSSSSSSLASNQPVTITVPTPDGGGSSKQPIPKVGTVLDQTIPAEVESLPLHDQDGRVVTLASLKGKTVVVSPNLTLCQEFCPLISSNLRAVDQAVNASGLTDKVVVLEVTVDPGRDDVKHLKAYQSLFGAEPNWEFLAGTSTQIAAFWKAFHLSYDKTANASSTAQPHDWLTGAPMTYDVSHSNIVYVLGPDGHIKWLVSANPYLNGAPIPMKLQTFLNENGLANRDNLPNPNWTASDVEQAVAYASGSPVTSS